MPSATGLAGVNMRLEAGAIRYVSQYALHRLALMKLSSELHWHTTPEWAYVLSVRLIVYATCAETHLSSGLDSSHFDQP